MYMHLVDSSICFYLPYFVCLACLSPSSPCSSLLCFVVEEKSESLLNKYKVCLALHYI